MAIVPLEPEFVVTNLATTRHNPGDRAYSYGLDRGMIFIGGVGIPWSGLISVDRPDTVSSKTPLYIDGQMFRIQHDNQEYQASIEAYSYPTEFEACIGVENENGLMITGQARERFSLAYRTKVSDDLDSEDYVLHLVYDAQAFESGHTSSTIREPGDPDTFSFEIYGIPEYGGGTTHAWTGAPNASTSTRTVSGETVTNLATNPSFEAASPVPVGGYRSDAWAASGSWSLHVLDEGYGLSPYGETPYGL